jgi:hypothetical protein
MRQPRPTAAEQRAAAHAAYRRKEEEEARARVEGVIAEFGGATDASTTLVRMAEELLYCRGVMQILIEVTDNIQAEKPFAVMGAGPLWEPPEVRRWWFR